MELSTGSLLIIAPEEFACAIEPLLEHKAGIGFPTSLAIIEDVCAFSSGVDDPERVKSFIAEAHTEWGVEYVMLVGDIDRFPVRYAARDAVEPVSYLPTDLYYADLYKPRMRFDRWDGNGNGMYGQIDRTARLNNLDSANWIPDYDSSGHIAYQGSNEAWHRNAAWNMLMAFQAFGDPSLRIAVPLP